MPSVRRRNGLYGKIPPGAKLIGRSTRWGNPFVIGKDGTRDEVIAKYRQALLAGDLRVSVDDVRRELRGRDLFCYCAPEPCHGDVLLEVANN